MKFDAGTIEGTADLDLGPFHAKLDEAEARAESFEHRTVTAKLGLDDSEALRTYVEMRDRLDEFSHQRAIAKVGVDTGTGRTDIEALRREIDSLDKTVHVRVDTSGSGNAGGAGGGGIGLRGALLGTLAALSPAAIPLGAVAGAGLLGTAGAAGTAGLGLGAFGLAAAPEVKQLSTAMTQLTAARTAYNKAVLEGSKSGEHDALAQQKNILAGLNAEQKTALGGLVAFQGAYKAFQHDLQPTVLLVLQDVLTTASRLLPIVEPLTKATGTALDGIVRDFNHQLSGGGLASFVQSLSKDVGPDLRLVANIIENLAADGGRLLVALQPLALTVLPALDRATRGLGTGSGLEHFISYAVKEAPAVGHALSGILGLAGSLVHALAPLGGAILVGLGNLARTLSHDLNSPAFAGFVHDLVRTVPPLASGLGHLAGAAVTLLHDLGPLLPVVAGLASDAANLLDHLGPLPAVVLGVWAAWKGFTIIGTALEAVQGFVSSSIARMGTLTTTAGTEAETVASLWRQAALNSATSFESFASIAVMEQGQIAAAAASDAAATETAWSNAAAARNAALGGGGGGTAVIPGGGGGVAAVGGLGPLKTIGGILPILGSSDSFSTPQGDLSAWSSAHPKQAAQYGWRQGSDGVWRDSRGTALSGAASGLTSTHRTDTGDLAAAYGAAHPLAPTHRTDIGDLAKTNPTFDQQNQALLNQITGAGNLAPFGADPGGAGGGGAAAANAQLVDYQRQISTGLASAIKRGVPAVQDETRKLRDTILREFKDPAAARERQQALALLAQEAPKALKQAQVNAQLAAAQLGKTIADEITKSVQSGVPAVVHEITKLQGEVIKKLSGEGQSAERKALLADLGRELPILKGYATQYAALQTALTADKTKLTNLQSAAASFRSSAYGALSGGASLTDALSSGQGITNYLGNQLTVLRTFVGELTQLKAAGVGPAAMEMIVAAGPVQGGAIAKALLTSGTAGQASSLVDAIQGLAGTTADQAEQQVYDPQIASVVAAQNATTKAVNDLNATISKSAKETGTAVAQGLTGTARTAKRKATGRTKPKTRASLR